MAVTVVVPSATPVNKPRLLIVAILVAEDVHVAVDETFVVVPPLNVAVAVNCCVAPTATDAVVGLSVSAVAAWLGAVVRLELVPPQPAIREIKMNAHNRYKFFAERTNIEGPSE